MSWRFHLIAARMFLLFAFLLSVGWASPEICYSQHAESAISTAPDLTQGEKRPENHTHDWNLGPTGARGWMYCDKLTSSNARQILVTEIANGSPADGVLKRGDVILGVAGKTFTYDPRVELGIAIGEAEFESGSLSLTRWRNDNMETVTVPLKVLGQYSE